LITLVIGNEALCSDGYRGEVRAVVIDPDARTVTHIVVEPDGRAGLARLVPLDLVEVASGQIQLRCTQPEFMKLDAAEETLAEFAVGQTVPVQLLVPGWRGADGPSADGGSIMRIPEKETIDVVPDGEVEEHGGDHVHATDGDIGQVRAFQIDPGSGQLTHLLLKEGHVWGRKDVAIPFDKVAGFDGGIRLTVTKQQVRDLAAVDIDHLAEEDR
jgi:sporulation protein YlmC with PRC-barrel domain